MNNKAFLLSVAVLFSMNILAGCALSEPSQQPILGNEAPFSLVIVPEEGAEDEPEVFLVADQMPEMIGGMERLQELMEYPEEALQQELEGRVFVEFIVNTEGVPQRLRVVRSSSEIFNEAAVSAIEQMRYTPGLQDEAPVNVLLTQALIFRL
jgi:protein TonB